jgi:phage/plasmid-like protein (TIGR03299 family)
MAHEIQKHDKVVLHKQQAWHGLGIVVEKAPTPKKALQLAGLGWEVEQWALSATNGERKRLALPEQVLNVRSDTLTPLGIVTTGYQPVQNIHLAEFCEMLAEHGDVVKVESAGSIRNGAKVWFLLKGASFSVRKKDEVRPYILVSNGHDGGTAIRCTPTTIRVVCSNTLHAVIPRYEKGKLTKAVPGCFVANHLGDVRQKVEQAKGALELYGKSIKGTRALIDAAAAKDLKREDVQRFFLECYTRDFGPIASNPKDAAEERARTKAQEACLKVSERFDRERELAGATAWNAFNAYTGWSQNDRRFWKNQAKEQERQIGSKLFGQDSERAIETLVAALAL